MLSPDSDAPPRMGTLSVGSRSLQHGAIAALLFGITLLLIVAPFYLGPYWLRVLSLIFMYATLAQGINLIAGFVGYPAFGNVVFFGVGAYSVAIVMVKGGGSFLTGWLVALALCMMSALIIGPALLRLRGHYFAIATVGLNETVKAVVDNLTFLTGGGMGLSLPLPPWTPLESARIFYYLLLGTMAVGILLAVWFRVSRLGYAARAIRDDEVKAEAMGLRTTTIKTVAWTVSAGLTGGVGAIYAYWFSYVEPPAVFDLVISIKAFVMFMLGGAATIFGPILGSFVVEYASTVLWSRFLEYHIGALGLGIILIALYMPDGLVLLARQSARRAFALLEGTRPS